MTNHERATEFHRRWRNSEFNSPTLGFIKEFEQALDEKDRFWSLPVVIGADTRDK